MKFWPARTATGDKISRRRPADSGLPTIVLDPSSQVPRPVRQPRHHRSVSRCCSRLSDDRWCRSCSRLPPPHPGRSRDRSMYTVPSQPLPRLPRLIRERLYGARGESPPSDGRFHRRHVIPWPRCTPSDSPQKHEDQHDHQYQPQSAAGTIAPVSAVSPSGKGHQKHQYQYD